MTDLHPDLHAMKGKLKEVEHLARDVFRVAKSPETKAAARKLVGALAEFHAGAAEMIIKHGPAAGLTDDQIQPLSGGEEKPPTVP